MKRFYAILAIPLTLLFSFQLLAQMPVAHFPFNGNANDVIGSNNGTVNGAILSNDRFGNANSAYSFNGLEQGITAPVPVTQTDNFTLQGWIKPVALSNGLQIILYNGNTSTNGWGLASDENGTLYVFFGGISLTSTTTTLSLNQWSHLALIRNSGITKVFLNANEIFSSALATPQTPSGNLLFGINNINTEAFNGSLDEIKIYNSALTAAQVSTEYNNGAVENDYRSATSGNWNNAATWERFDGLAFVPASNPPSAADGLISIRNGHNVTISTDLTTDQTIVESGGTLTQSSNLTINNGPNEDLMINGTWDWIAGSLTQTGTSIITTSGAMLLTSGNDKPMNGSVITNNGSIDWQDGNIRFDGNISALINNGNFIISGNNSSGYNGGQLNFSNYGTITKTSNGATNLGGFQLLQNAGTLNCNAGDFVFGNPNAGGTFTNTGNITLNNGTFSVGPSLSITYNHNTGANISGTGNFINGGNINFNVNHEFTPSVNFSSNGTIDGPGNLIINNPFNIVNNITGGGVLNIKAAASWKAGSLSRQIIIDAAHSFNIVTGNDKPMNGSVITNNGTIDWQDGNIRFDGNISALINNGNFIISGNNSSGYNGGQLNFSNYGTITKTSNGATNLGGFQLLQNAGTLNCNAGDFVFGNNNAGGAFSNAGIIHLNNANFTNIANGSSFANNSNGILNGTGNFTFSAGFNNSGNISPSLLNINGLQPLENNSVLNITMQDATGPGTGHSQLQRNSSLTLAGTLIVTETGSVPPGIYKIIDLMQGTITGNFSAINLPVNYTLQINSSSVDLIKSFPCNNPEPLITANGPTTFCNGGSVTLTSDKPSGNLWSNGETTQTITVTTEGIYTVTNTDGNNCSSTSGPVNIIVNEVPVTPVITANGPITICDGSTVMLSSDAASGNLWSNGETSQSIEVSNSGIFSVTATNIFDCSSTPSNAIEVIKLNRPAAPVITASGSTSLCFGQSVTLTSDKPTGNFWNTGAQTQSISVDYFSAGEYRLFYVDENNCVSQIATVNIIDLPQAPLPLISASGPTNFCPGNSVTLTSSIVEGVTWSTGETTQSITVTNSGNYSVSITNSNGCSTENGPVPVTVYPVPETPTIITNGPTSFCSGGNVELTSSMAVLGNANSWSNGSVGQSTIINSSGLYTLSYTDNNGCVSPASAPVAVTVYPLPAAPVITANGPTNICPGTNVQLVSNELTGNLWSNGATGRTIIVGNTGNFTCRKINNNGCYSLASNEITVQLKSAEIPVVQISTPTTTVCRYQVITFTAAILSEIPPTYSIIWRVIRNGSHFNPAGNYGHVFTTSSFTLENGDIVYCQYFSNDDCYNPILESNQIQITVLNPANAGNILGPGTLITGSNASFTSNGSPNGIWESSNIAVATIDAVTGLCTPISAGTALISYTIVTGCNAPRTVRKTITVLNGNELIIGPQIICPFSPTNYNINTSLLSNINGGTWSCSNPNVALLYQYSSPSFVLVSSNTQIPFDLYFTLSNGTVLTKHIDVYSPPTLGPIIGPRNLCQQIIFGYFGNYPYPTFTYRREAVSPVTGYNWTVPSQLLEIVSGQGTTQITVRLKQNFSFNSTMYLTATPVAPCQTQYDPQNTIVLTFGVLPPTPSPIIASANNICPLIGTNNTVQYTINKIGDDASYYEWITPAGTTVTHPYSGANDTVILVKFLAGYQGGDISVNAQNACGSGGIRTLNVPRNIPAMPSNITGPTNSCAHQLPGGTLATYSVPAVSGMTYTWTVPAGVISFTGQGTNSISFRYPNGFTSGTISVTATDGCGTSSARNMNIGTLYPSTPGVIDVIQELSCPNRIYSYTIAALPSNSSGVLWTVPQDGTIINGQGTRKIFVSYANTSINGKVTVTATGNCRNSASRAVTVKLPACSGGLTGRNNTDINTDLTELNKPDSGDTKFSASIFPNPSSGPFHVKIITAGKETIQLMIRNAIGKIYRRQSIQPNQTVLIGEDLPPGIYLLEIIQKQGTRIEKLVKL